MMKLLAMPLALALLPGAALPADDLTNAALCNATKIGAEFAFQKLTVTAREDESMEGEKAMTYRFAPSGSTVLGNATTRVEAYDYVEEGRGTLRLETAAPGDYTRARAAMLQLHGKAECDSEIGPAGQRTCELQLEPKGEWKRTSRLLEGQGTLETTCVYTTD